MATEVIDLISSPEAVPSPRQRRLQPAPSKQSIRRPENGLSDLEELPLARQQLSKQTSPPRTVSEAVQGQQFEAGGVVILSDDFDTSYQDDTGDEFSGPSKKRPRVSEMQTSPSAKADDTAKSVASARTIARLRCVPPTTFKRQLSAPEPIELSSSPLPRPRASKPAGAHHSLNTSVSSSPNPGAASLNPLEGKPDEFERNPFASSPPRRKPEAHTRKPAEWDPISSSAPEVYLDEVPKPRQNPLRRSQSEVVTICDSDSDNKRASSEDEFPDIVTLDPAQLRTKMLVRKPLAETQSKTAMSSKPSRAKTTEEKSWKKGQRALAREAEKQRKLREKERARQDKAAEKQRAAALAEVNKVRTDKKISTPEMIVDLPTSLNETVRLQAETLLKDLNVEVSTRPGSVGNVITWRRKVRSRFNEEMGHWEPIPQRIEPEKYAMALVPAKDFVQFATAPGSTDLEAHVQEMRQHHPGYTLIYLIEGLAPWMRNNRNIRNRQFVSAVRDGIEEVPPVANPSLPQSRRRRNVAQAEYIDEERVEDALLQLQVLHKALIHHTNAAVETAQWIAIFTQHISTVPYRRQREQTNASTAAFCMETGQVRTGDGPKDTYVRMLQEIARVTAPVAYGIAAEFETVPKLVKGLEAGGPLILEQIRRSANKDGALSDRTVGQAVSRRLYKIFTGTDEMSTDV